MDRDRRLRYRKWPLRAKMAARLVAASVLPIASSPKAPKRAGIVKEPATERAP